MERLIRGWNAGIANPVPVGLTVGNDGGATQVPYTKQRNWLAVPRLVGDDRYPLRA